MRTSSHLASSHLTITDSEGIEAIHGIQLVFIQQMRVAERYLWWAVTQDKSQSSWGDNKKRIRLILYFEVLYKRNER